SCAAAGVAAEPPDPAYAARPLASLRPRRGVSPDARRGGHPARHHARAGPPAGDPGPRGAAAGKSGSRALPSGRVARGLAGDHLHLAEVRETAERVELDLTHPLAGEDEPLADFLERLGLLVDEP